MNRFEKATNKEKQRFLAIQQAHHAKLKEIVESSIKEEKLINQSLLNPQVENLTLGQRLADRIADFGGSWRFILTFSGILLAWVIYNSVALINMRFDPFPFILMNLFLSTIAAFQGPFIMMSQNRQEEKDRERAENDYMVNLKAEMEIRGLHQKMDLMLKEHMRAMYDAQADQLTLLREIETKIKNPI